MQTNNYLYTQNKHTNTLTTYKIQIKNKSKGQRIAKFVRVNESESTATLDEERMQIHKSVRKQSKEIHMFTISFFLQIGN